MFSCAVFTEHLLCARYCAKCENKEASSVCDWGGASCQTRLALPKTSGKNRPLPWALFRASEHPFVTSFQGGSREIVSGQPFEKSGSLLLVPALGPLGGQAGRAGSEWWLEKLPSNAGKVVPGRVPLCCP